MEAVLNVTHPGSVIPAKAGIHHKHFHTHHAESVSVAETWIPAGVYPRPRLGAGMTVVGQCSAAGE